MNQKLKNLGFQSVKTVKSKAYISIDEVGYISFSSSLRRELSIKRTENCSIYFNPDEGILAIHIGTFDIKKNREMTILQISSEYTIRARNELLAIQEQHPGYNLIPEEGKPKINYEDIEVEKFTEPPDPYSRMVLVAIKKEKTSFRP
jgi:hypothetical protein